MLSLLKTCLVLIYSFCLEVLASPDLGIFKQQVETDQAFVQRIQQEARDAVQHPCPACTHEETIASSTSPKPPSPASNTGPLLSGERYPSDLRLLVFISASQPIAALKTLAHEVQAAKGALVLRGLIENSWSKTLTWLKNIEVPVLLDPRLFTQFKITRVPAFVLLYGPLTETVTFEALYGQVTVPFALETLQRQQMTQAEIP